MAHSVKPGDAGISVGQVLQGKYRVDSILGAGGMGVVAECTHLQLNERVAIKMLRTDVMLDPDAKTRFLREAQAAVKLKSEYVARVSDVGTFDGGVPYMVMEFLEGHDLGEFLKQRGVLPMQWAVELMLQTAEALCEAHSLGIVHRDIKPTNLFVTERPDGTTLVKVLDFGISKSAAGTDMHLTQTQSLLGTPAYMSPEQMRSARLVDTRTDIWSLGTVFYEALEGHRPFEAESFSEMCVKVAVDDPAPMRNTPPALQHVIMRCLAKAPEQRYFSMAEFARDLIAFAADPHGAQMLVERMARMLRRANMDWEGGSTGVGRQAVPGSLSDVGSGPVRVPGSAQWGLGSDPAGAPFQAKSDPAMRQWHSNTPPPRGDASQPFTRPFPNDASQPFARPLDEHHSGAYAATLAQQPKKSRVGLVLLFLGVLTAGAIAFGLVKATEQQGTETSEGLTPQTGTETGSAAQPMQQTDTATGAAAGVDKQPDTATGAAAGVDKQPDTAGSAAVVDKQPDTAGSAAVVDKQPTTADKQPDTADKLEKGKGTAKTGAGKAVQGKTGGTAKAGQGKAGAGTAKSGGTAATIKANAGSAAPLVEDKVEPPKKPCDPFGSMHGCEKSK